MNRPALLSLLLCVAPSVISAQELVLIEDVTPARPPGRLPPLKGQWIAGEAFTFGDRAPRWTLLVPGADPLAVHPAAPMLADLQSRYRDRGLRVLGVAPTEPSASAMEQWGELALLQSRALGRVTRASYCLDSSALLYCQIAWAKDGRGSLSSYALLRSYGGPT